jgi:hypothetical protein
MKTLVLVEHDGAQIKDATLAAVTAASQLGEVHLLVAGAGVGDVADAAAKVAANPDAKLLAGGQSMIASMKLRLANPGQVVDLGTITYPGLEATGARNSATNAMTDTGQPSIAIVPAAAGAPLPARRPGLTVVPAHFRAAPKMPNFMGLHVDRHPALTGVLRYERDVVIDDQTGQPVAGTP